MKKLLKKLTADDQFIMENHPTDVGAEITEEEAIRGLKKIRKKLRKSKKSSTHTIDTPY